jgi:hypothetical protein
MEIVPRLTAFVPLRSANKVTWALGRLPNTTYAYKTFSLPVSQSRDYGEPARYIYKVFDEPAEPEDLTSLPDVERTEHVVYITLGQRKQIKLQVTRQAGNIRQIEIQKVPTDPGATEVQTILKLHREASARLILLARTLDSIPVQGGEDSIGVQDGAGRVR